MPQHKFAILKDSIEATTKHYLGFPPEITGNDNDAILLKRAKLLVIYDTEGHGYELSRYDEDGEFAGDTLHPTEDAVTEEVKIEFNLKGIFWRNIPKYIVDPVEYAIDFMKGKRK